MNLYKISCLSSCGTYFVPYLQSVTVAADTPDLAVAFLKEWMRREGRNFINNDEKKWNIELLVEDVRPGVVDWHEDSDY